MYRMLPSCSSRRSMFPAWGPGGTELTIPGPIRPTISRSSGAATPNVPWNGPMGSVIDGENRATFRGTSMSMNLIWPSGNSSGSAPVERCELEEPDAQHVTRLGALDGDRADDRVRAPTRVVTAKLGELLDRDAGLEPVHEVGPGVGVYHGVAGVDLYDVGSSCVEGAQTHRFRRGLHRVDPSPRRGDAASECRT